MTFAKLKVFLPVVLAAILASQGSADAAGKRLLGGLKFDFWSSSSQEQEESAANSQPQQQTASAEGCWYENQWQRSRHGKRLEGRVRHCSSK